MKIEYLKMAQIYRFFILSGGNNFEIILNSITKNGKRILEANEL